MAPCIIDFIGAIALLGPVGGRGPWTLLGPNGNRFAGCHFRAQEWHLAKLHFFFSPISLNENAPVRGYLEKLFARYSLLMSHDNWD
jgi:hypothetical protein